MNNKPEEFKERLPDVIIAPKDRLVACPKCGEMIKTKEDFGDVLVAIHHHLYSKRYCSVGANKWRLGDLAQVEKWFELEGLDIPERWEYKYGNNKQEGFAIMLKLPKKNL